MAVRRRRSNSCEVSSLTKVTALVRPNIIVVGERERVPRTIGSIACAHGASLESVYRLARDGRFSGKVPDQKQFYTVPNYRFRKLEKSPLDPAVIQKIKESKIDVIHAALEYAEMDEVQDYQRGDCINEAYEERGGAVIAFSGRVLTRETELYEDEIHDSLELILPTAPSIDDIEGIYPIDVYSFRKLEQYLRRLSTS